MTGKEFVANFSVDGYGLENLVELKAIIDYIFNEQLESDWNDKEGSQGPQLSAVTQTLLFLFLLLLFSSKDFSWLWISCWTVIESIATTTVPLSLPLSRGNRKKTGAGSSFFLGLFYFDNILIKRHFSFIRNVDLFQESQHFIAVDIQYALDLLCFNSAVVVQEIKQSTRSIIVRSGTLLPSASYQSEHDIDFKLTWEANHVIPAKRVWIGN